MQLSNVYASKYLNDLGSRFGNFFNPTDGGQDLPDVFQGLWPSIWVSIATVLSLIVLFVVISRLVYFPVKNSLQERQDKIQKDFDDAAKMNSYAVETSQKIDKEYKNIKIERAQIINNSKTEAFEMKNEIVLKAQKDAENMLVKAEAQIEKERTEAFDTLKDQISLISVEIAEKLIDKKIDLKTNEKMIDELITKIDLNDK